MRPQDIVILLKIISKREVLWQNKDLAQELIISQSEISESLNRCVLSGLLSSDKKKVHRLSFFEFIEKGFKYVFPVAPGGMVNGIATAHSHPFMKEHFQSQVTYVWPGHRGKDYGLAVEPLYKELPNAIKQDDALYKSLALLDVLRLGRAREVAVALRELRKIILVDKSQSQYTTDKSS